MISRVERFSLLGFVVIFQLYVCLGRFTRSSRSTGGENLQTYSLVGPNRDFQYFEGNGFQRSSVPLSKNILDALQNFSRVKHISIHFTRFQHNAVYDSLSSIQNGNITLLDLSLNFLDFQDV